MPVAVCSGLPWRCSAHLRTRPHRALLRGHHRDTAKAVRGCPALAPKACGGCWPTSAGSWAPFGCDVKARAAEPGPAWPHSLVAAPSPGEDSRAAACRLVMSMRTAGRSPSTRDTRRGTARPACEEPSSRAAGRRSVPLTARSAPSLALALPNARTQAPARREAHGVQQLGNRGHLAEGWGRGLGAQAKPFQGSGSALAGGSGPALTMALGSGAVAAQHSPGLCPEVPITPADRPRHSSLAPACPTETRFQLPPRDAPPQRAAMEDDAPNRREAISLSSVASGLENPGAEFLESMSGAHGGPTDASAQEEGRSPPGGWSPAAGGGSQSQASLAPTGCWTPLWSLLSCPRRRLQLGPRARRLCREHAQLLRWIRTGLLCTAWAGFLLAACLLDFQRALALFVLSCVVLAFLAHGLLQRLLGPRLRRWAQPLGSPRLRRWCQR
ncbi:Sodium/nucleoside cotransporter 1 [Galemys pyrenaicus]|uniref:Sodium/nucleoside cotransporter 1 n=1 Tax=Galemys pyrenaicus TaxID=202257 RepID=A0A8J6DPZ8_GALPY|nr:Sodium/nucleoside cotransporter 1 [Galemys pyrenaicus]